MTKESILTSLQMLRVHIAPVGFEVDRIALPAIDMKADRVWLITDDKPKEDEGSKFVKLIQRKLKEVRIECFQAEADRIDLFDILRVQGKRQLHSRQCVCGK